jgi:hypothetical protein
VLGHRFNVPSLSGGLTLYFQLAQGRVREWCAGKELRVYEGIWVYEGI